MAKVTKTTLDLIHREYQIAAQKSDKILQLVENLYKNLSKQIEKVPPKDVDSFYSFLNGLECCLIERSMTFEITDFFTDLNSTLMYIIKWLNDTQNQNIDINWYGRRKALESDLTKILDKTCNSDNHESVSIRDRFGLRGLLLNKDAREKRIEKIHTVYKAIADILTKKNSPVKTKFIEWYQNNTSINKLARCKLDIVLEIPFQIANLKNYIAHPKENNYQTLQFSLEIAMYSEILPGAKIELQLRDLEMHYTAEHGSAAHTNYKDEIDKQIQETFILEDFSQIHLSGFTNYEQQYEDRDGLHYPKHFADRRSI